MKRILAGLAAMMMLMFGLVSPAAADDHAPAITPDPANVEAAGEHEITVTGSGYTGAAFLLPCPGANGDPTGMGEDSCDLAALTPVSPDADGNFEASATFDIPEEGLVIVVGNAAQTEVAVGVITVGAAMEAMEEEAPAEEAMEEAEAMDDGDLADTGVESSVFILVGVTMLIAGALFLGSKRDLISS